MKKDYDKNIPKEFNNFINPDNQNIKESRDQCIDKEIYAKFLLFLQFQEKMKKEINN